MAWSCSQYEASSVVGSGHRCAWLGLGLGLGVGVEVGVGVGVGVGLGLAQVRLVEQRLHEVRVQVGGAALGLVLVGWQHARAAHLAHQLVEVRVRVRVRVRVLALALSLVP